MLFIFALLTTTLSATHAARVLALFPLGSKSHHYFLQSIAKTLAQAGHEVEVYSPFPDLLRDSPSNITHYHLKGIEIVDQRKDLFLIIEHFTKLPFWQCLDIFWTSRNTLYKDFIKDEEIKKLLASGKHFDLVIGEIFNIQEFLPIFSRVFNAPMIGLQAYPSNNLVNNALGNSLSISFIPDLCSPFSDKMSFIERVFNAISSYRGLYYHQTYYYKDLESAMRKDFPNMPSVEELTRSISLMFVNDHVTVDYARPRTPNVIPVGGVHIGLQPLQPLPQNIAEFMGNATDGVIFFSLGTYVADDEKPKEYFDMYINIFKRLKQRVIWKTRNNKINDLPENIMMLKWAPQKEILAHPACVLFITHGGHNSLLEAFHFEVPVVCIPQFFDQRRNSELYVSKGVGVGIPAKGLTAETVSKAIATVIGTPSYRENMKRWSTIFRDQPMSPAESVVFWTEYVLRNRGAAHLRPASTELRWYQLILLDVVFISIITISMLLITTYLFFRTLLKYIILK